MDPMTTQSGMKVDFRRDQHGNLRVEDFDASAVPWAKPERKVRRERQVRRSVKYFNPE